MIVRSALHNYFGLRNTLLKIQGRKLDPRIISIAKRIRINTSLIVSPYIADGHEGVYKLEFNCLLGHRNRLKFAIAEVLCNKGEEAGLQTTGEINISFFRRTDVRGNGRRNGDHIELESFIVGGRELEFEQPFCISG